MIFIFEAPHFHILSDPSDLLLPKAAMNFMPALAIRILIANNCTIWRGIFKGFSEDGRRTAFLKTSAPVPLIKSLRMRPLLDWSISLDSIHSSNKSLPVHILHVLPSVQNQDFLLDPRILKVSLWWSSLSKPPFSNFVGSFRSRFPKAAMTGDTLVQSHAMAKSLAKRFAEEAAAPPAFNLEAAPLSTTEADEELCVANSV